MARTIHASTAAELAKDNFTLVTLLWFDFPSPIYITSAAHTVNYFATDWVSSPHLAKVSQADEDSKLKVGTLRVELGAADQTWVAIFLNNDWADIRTVYYKAVLDSSGAVIGSPIVFFDGTITGFTIQDSAGGSSKISVSCASHWANFEVVSGRMTNMESQQAHFSNDLGMQYAAHTVRDIEWGPDAKNRVPRYTLIG